MANLKILKKKVLIAGANGLLGQKLVQVFEHDYEVYGLGLQELPAITQDHYVYTQCDITERTELLEHVTAIKPNIVINAAAYTDVDGCEENKEDCWRVNVIGVENLAYVARKVGAMMVHVSTDYVFDGEDGNYDEKATPNPLGYYGRSKLASENALLMSGVTHATVRTQILYGTGVDVGSNFATWLVKTLGKGQAVNIVDDQFGNPTLVDDLAHAIKQLAEKEKADLFHVAGAECVSRYEFAIKLAEKFGFDTGLVSRITSKQLNQKAPRPLNSSFNLSKLENELGIQMSDVDTGLSKLKQQLEQ